MRISLLNLVTLTLTLTRRNHRPGVTVYILPEHEPHGEGIEWVERGLSLDQVAQMGATRRSVLKNVSQEPDLQMDIACVPQPFTFYPGRFTTHGVLLPVADQWKDLREPVLDFSFDTEVAPTMFEENEAKRHKPSK
jgi:hypothetical protein